MNTGGVAPDRDPLYVFPSRMREGMAIRLRQPPLLVIGNSRRLLKDAQEHLPGQPSSLGILVRRMI